MKFCRSRIDQGKAGWGKMIGGLALVTLQHNVMICQYTQVTLPEKVDLLVSEPFGYMLYNERMLETYLHAKKWLKPGGEFTAVRIMTLKFAGTWSCVARLPLTEELGQTNFVCVTKSFSLSKETSWPCQTVNH